MIRPTILTLVSLIAFEVPVWAVPPSAAVLPGNTKFHVSIPDVPKLEKAWKKTKLAQLFDDPKLKPFLEDLIKGSTLDKLHLEWADLESVANGEMSFSTIPVDAKGGQGQVAHVLTIDATGKSMALVKFLAKVSVSLKKEGYQAGTAKFDGGAAITHTRTARDNKERDHRLLTFTKDEMLVVADNDKGIEVVLKRWDGTSADRLDQHKAYQEVQARAKAKTKNLGDLFWFMEPLGLAELGRAARRTTLRRGPDTLKILKDEGFTAFQGLGGFVTVGQGEYDLLHHTAVYAPGPYQKSMRMLKSLPGDNFVPADWVPGDLATFAIGYLDVENAYQAFGSFFDAYFGDGDAGTFDDIVKGLRDDPNGPQVDIGKEIIGRLGQRVTLLADTEKPIGAYSTRNLSAVETRDEKGVADAIRRLMENDEDVKRHDLSDNVVLWELITREKKKKGAKPAVAKPKAPNSAVAVARGQLFLASDMKLLEKILSGNGTGLVAQPDYQRVAKELANLGAGKDCLRSFARPDDDLQTVYEMLRTNQLDQTRSLYAQILLDLFGDQVKKIDGSKMPAFDNFRPYVGPTGLYCVNETDGWFAVGVALRKQ